MSELTVYQWWWLFMSWLNYACWLFMSGMTNDCWLFMSWQTDACWLFMSCLTWALTVTVCSKCLSLFHYLGIHNIRVEFEQPSEFRTVRAAVRIGGHIRDEGNHRSSIHMEIYLVIFTMAIHGTLNLHSACQDINLVNKSTCIHHLLLAH